MVRVTSTSLQVFYLSGQLNQYLPAEVTRLLRTPSGAAWAEGWVTDGGAGGKSGGLTWFWFVLSVVWAGYGRVHDLLSHGFLGRFLLVNTDSSLKSSEDDGSFMEFRGSGAAWSSCVGVANFNPKTQEFAVSDLWSFRTFCVQEDGQLKGCLLSPTMRILGPWVACCSQVTRVSPSKFGSSRFR